MTRRLTLRLTLVLLALTMGLPGAVAADTGSSTKVYLALGDSLAVGEGATQGYVPRLHAFFSQPQHGNVDPVSQDPDTPGGLENLGIGGETSSSMLGEQLTAALNIINEPTDVRVVTLDIGGNDIRRLLAEDSPCVATSSKPIDPIACQQLVAAILNDFAVNYAQILAELTQALEADPGNESLLVMTYYNPYEGAPLAEAAVRSLNNLIASIGAQYGATIVDVYPEFVGKGPSLIRAGDFHPNDDGYKVIAEAFIEAYKLHGFKP